MQATASGLIEAIKNTFTSASEWDKIPLPEPYWDGTKWVKKGTGLYNYGGGGIGGWGSLCGTPNGACAVLGLMGLPSAAASELMGWYQLASIPDEKWGNELAGYVTPVPYQSVPAIEHDHYVPTVAHSQLCHTSISTFCDANGIALGANAAGLPYMDPSKADRCGKLCGDTAYKAAELINEIILYSSITPQYELPAAVAACLHCHNDSSSDVNRYDISGKLDCNICHINPTTVGRRHPYHGGGGGMR